MNAAGLDLVKEYEGCKLTAYLCPADVATIGYGHTGPDVERADVGRMTISQDMADKMLLSDLAVVEDRVRRLVHAPVTGNELAALTSFAYNLGVGNLQSSTLLRLLNSGAPKAVVASEFPKWCRAGGKVLAGLVARRAAERDLFLRPDEV